MKVALIGAGSNGAAHMRRVAALEGITVVGIADPVLERAEALASEVGGKAYRDHRQMLDEMKPDAVWISSPGWLHAEHAVDCATAGAHIMCEKPMALTLEDCDRMIAAARANKVKLSIGQSTRYSAPLLELKRLLESGRCGDLVTAWSLRMAYHQVRPGSEWRLDGEKSGGIVMEWEVHEIDFVRSLGGRVSQVYARTAYSREDAPTFLDHFSAILTFEKGGYANLEASQSCPVGLSGRGFVGTKGAAEAYGAAAIRFRTLEMEQIETVTVPPCPWNVDTDFVRAIQEDAPAPIPGEEGRANVEIGLAIVRSGETGEAISLPIQ